MRGALERIVKHRKPSKTLRTTWNTMKKQGVFMRGCLRKDCKASERLQALNITINTMQTARFIDTEMLERKASETFNNIENNKTY